MRFWTRKPSATSTGGSETAASSVPGYDDPERGLYVYLCHRCGQPLEGAYDLCKSALHAGGDGLGVGLAMRSTELAGLAGAARAALGAR
jgi:hypothetical protein